MSDVTWAGGGGFSDMSVVLPTVALADMNTSIDAMAKVKPRWIRTICAWNYIAKSRAAGAAVASPPTYGTAPFAFTPPTTKNRDWSSLDRCVNEILRRIPSADIQLIIGQGKPSWAASIDGAGPTDYANFCTELAERFGPGGNGIAPDNIAAGRYVWNYEIWNEQNNKAFWTWGNVNPAGYVTLLTAAHAALKAAQPGCSVIFGSYQHVPHTGPWYGAGWITQPEIEWWQDCFNSGLGDVFDVVGMHPYSLGDYEYNLGPLEPSLTLNDAWLQFQSITDLLASKGFGAKPRRITEIGYPTSMCTYAQQKQFHLESRGFWQAMENVDGYIIYCCRDDGTDITNKEQSMGIMTNAFLPKDMYYYLQSLQGGLIQTPVFVSTAAMAAPAIHTSISIAAAPFIAASALSNPRVLMNVVLPPPFMATATTPAPSMHLSTALTATAATATAGMPTPTVTTISPPPITHVTPISSGDGALAENTTAMIGTVAQDIEIDSGLLSSYLLVALVLTHNFQISYTGLTTLEAACAGTPMTLLGSTDIGGAIHQGSVHVFGLANPPPGLTQHVEAQAGHGTLVVMSGLQLQTLLLEGVLGIGDIVTSRSSNFWTVNSSIETSPDDWAVLVVGSGKMVTSCTGTIEYNWGDATLDGNGQFMMMADMAASSDGSTTISATFRSGPYASIGVQVEFDPSIVALIESATPFAATAAFPSPVVHLGDTLAAAPFTAAAGMAAPVVSTSDTVNAAPFTATAAAAAPTVSTTTGGTVNAVPFTATAGMAAPVVSATVNITVTAAPFTATAAAAAPSVSFSDNVTVTAAPFTATAAAATPTVTADVSVTAAPFTATAAAAPVVTVGGDTITVTAAPFTATAAAAAPVVTVGGDTITVTAAPFTATAAAAAPVPKLSYDLTLSGTTLPTSGPTGQPTVVAHTSAAATSVTMPSGVLPGDLIIVAAFRDGSSTAPTLDASYIQFASVTGTSCSMRVAVRKATGTDTSGTWTNATGIVVIVVRGCDNPSMTATTGGSQANAGTGSGTGGTITYPAATLSKTDGSSLIIRFAGQRDATNLTTNAPTGYAQVDGTATEVCAVLANANTSSNPATGTQATNGTTGWTAATLELVAATTSFGTCVPVTVSSGIMREGDSEAAVNADYYEAWLSPYLMDTDVYTAHATCGNLTSGSARGNGVCVGAPANTVPVTKALIGIMNQTTTAGAAILTWDGQAWTSRATGTGTGTSANSTDTVGIRISKSAGIYTYTLQHNGSDTTVSWTDSGAAFGVPGPRTGGAMHHTRSSGVQGTSPGVTEMASADT